MEYKTINGKRSNVRKKDGHVCGVYLNLGGSKVRTRNVAVRSRGSHYNAGYLKRAKNRRNRA